MARRPRSTRPVAPVEVAPPVQAEPAPPPAGINITQLDVERARRRRRAPRNPRLGLELIPTRFEIPANLHPPSATPASGHNGGPTLAADEDIRSVFAWANANAMYSSMLEGQLFLGYPYLASLSQRPEYRVISETIANEMTREWIEIKSVANDSDKTEKIKKLTDEMKRLKVRNAFRRAAAGDGYFGRHHIFIDVDKSVDDPDELKTSIGDGRSFASRFKVKGPDGDKEGSKIRLQSVEAMWAYPTEYNATDPLKEDWYRPQTWYVQRRELHRTRLLTLVGREVPDILKPAYSFGGLSLSQQVKPYVDNWLRTRQSVSDLVHNFSVLGLKTKLGSTLRPARRRSRRPRPIPAMWIWPAASSRRRRPVRQPLATRRASMPVSTSTRRRFRHLPRRKA